VRVGGNCGGGQRWWQAVPVRSSLRLMGAAPRAGCKGPRQTEAKPAVDGGWLARFASFPPPACARTHTRGCPHSFPLSFPCLCLHIHTRLPPQLLPSTPRAPCAVCPAPAGPPTTPTAATAAAPRAPPAQGPSWRAWRTCLRATPPSSWRRWPTPACWRCVASMPLGAGPWSSTRVRTRTRTCMCTCTSMHTHTCAHMRAHTLTLTRAHAHTHTHTHAHTHAHSHVHAGRC